MAAWWDVPSLIANDDLPPLPPRLATLAALTGRLPLAQYEAAHGPWSWPEPSELTEIAQLARDGWHLPEPHVVNLVLPFAWPAEHRGWLPNRVPHVWHSNVHLIPPTAADDEHDTDPAADELGAMGVDVFPGRRLWLLRSPFPAVPVPALLDGLLAHAKTLAAQRGVDLWQHKQVVFDAAHVVFSLDAKAFDAWRRMFVT
ncbi:hypothetical protein [Tenggerimyces flavus]|uniref:Uncharacterized protein n=1 Tax=Tenggerimyces flavus TaxID=1708749 RepID=A0ABV7Y541_9ACTN|nr:hypothetical protein [Tenggerimyces flavus]MBM7791135.1 hypothetical protein [Tenggerimyces flavus]